MTKRIAALAVLLCFAAVNLYSADNMQRGGAFVIKPGEATEDQTFVVADFATNTNNYAARKWSLLALADTTEFTLYLNSTYTDSLVMFRPPGVGFSSWDFGDVSVFKVKMDRRSTAGYAEFIFFYDR